MQDTIERPPCYNSKLSKSSNKKNYSIQKMRNNVKKSQQTSRIVYEMTSKNYNMRRNMIPH